MVGVGKEVVRTVFADPNRTSHGIPVDICIQFMLLAAWCKAVDRYFKSSTLVCLSVKIFNINLLAPEFYI
jgi:hypothetical protein